MRIVCVAILAATAAPFNVIDFGAKGDGVTDDTAAFQAAIDAVAERGAGKIIVPYSPKGYRIAGLDIQFESTTNLLESVRCNPQTSPWDGTVPKEGMAAFLK